LGSIINEATGFLSLASEDGRWIPEEGSVKNKLDDTTFQRDTRIELNGTSRVNAKAVCKCESISNDTLHVDEADGTHGSESSYQLTQEESEKSSDETTYTSVSSVKYKEEIVVHLAGPPVERRLIAREDGHIMYGQEVNEDMSRKTDSSDVSKDSSESNATMNSIMEEALGFLSRSAEEGLWIKADNGQMLFVRCVNGFKGHKTDCGGEKDEVVGVDLGSTESALQSNEESKGMFRVEAADLSKGYELSNRSHSSGVHPKLVQTTPVSAQMTLRSNLTPF
jgi:hypothetical protein